MTDRVPDQRTANQDKCHRERKRVVEGELAVNLSTELFDYLPE